MRSLITILAALTLASCGTVRLNSCVGPYMARTCAYGQIDGLPESQRSERADEDAESEKRRSG